MLKLYVYFVDVCHEHLYQAATPAEAYTDEQSPAKQQKTTDSSSM